MGARGSSERVNVQHSIHKHTIPEIPLKIRLKFSNKSVWVCFWISSGESWRMSLPQRRSLQNLTASCPFKARGCVVGVGGKPEQTGPGRGRRDRSNLCAQPFPIPCPGSTASKRQYQTRGIAAQVLFQEGPGTPNVPLPSRLLC